MESPEVKKRKLIAQLVAAANKHINQTGQSDTANYVVVPDKNIESIAKKLDAFSDDQRKKILEGN